MPISLTPYPPMLCRSRTSDVSGSDDPKPSFTYPAKLCHTNGFQRQRCVRSLRGTVEKKAQDPCTPIGAFGSDLRHSSFEGSSQRSDFSAHHTHEYRIHTNEVSNGSWNIATTTDDVGSLLQGSDRRRSDLFLWVAFACVSSSRCFCSLCVCRGSVVGVGENVKEKSATFLLV